eukprot:scaffold2869_cov210-Ochromonas_danica.AAC.1
MDYNDDEESNLSYDASTAVERVIDNATAAQYANDIELGREGAYFKVTLFSQNGGRKVFNIVKTILPMIKLVNDGVVQKESAIEH